MNQITVYHSRLDIPQILYAIRGTRTVYSGVPTTPFQQRQHPFTAIIQNGTSAAARVLSHIHTRAPIDATNNSISLYIEIIFFLISPHTALTHRTLLGKPDTQLLFQSFLGMIGIVRIFRCKSPTAMLHFPTIGTLFVACHPTSSLVPS